MQFHDRNARDLARAFVAVVLAVVVIAAAPFAASAQAPGCDPADTCCSQCDLAVTLAEQCPNDTPFEDYEDLAATRADWLAELSSEGCEGAGSVWGLLEGACGNGTTWIHTRNSIYAGEARFHDAGGAFLGLSNGSDVIDPVCGLETYYPSQIVCPESILTQIHCGLWWELFSDPLVVGQEFYVAGTVPGASVPVTDPLYLIPVLTGIAWIGLRRHRPVAG